MSHIILLAAFSLCLVTRTEAWQQQALRPRVALRSRLCMELAEWNSCKVLSNEPEADGLRLIEVAAGKDIGAEYSTPGQYLKIRQDAEGKPGFYAIASPPDKRETLSFLVKDSESNAFFAGAHPGDKLDLSAPQGSGFKVTEFFDSYQTDWPVNNVMLLAAGSGLAPIAAAIEFPELGLRQKGSNSLFTREAVLYVGARSEAHLPLRSRYATWEKLGVKVVPVLSQPGEGWTGRTGYVQSALKADGVKVPRNSAALLCGQRGMTEECRDIMLEAGTFEGRILLNF